MPRFTISLAKLFWFAGAHPKDHHSKMTFSRSSELFTLMNRASGSRAITKHNQLIPELGAIYPLKKSSASTFLGIDEVASKKF